MSFSGQGQVDAAAKLDEEEGVDGDSGRARVTERRKKMSRARPRSPYL